MITYEYKCDKCQHQFEADQRITDKPLEKCPKCYGAVRRLITGGSALITKSASQSSLPCGLDSPCAAMNSPCCGGKCSH
ncbi:MAG: zinc ribbon domain-containing protein [Pseudomonadota bacterium]